MLLKSHHIVCSFICSGHLELEITRRLVGVALVTRRSVTPLLVVNSQRNQRELFIFLSSSGHPVSSPPVLSGIQVKETVLVSCPAPCSVL